MRLHIYNYVHIPFTATKMYVIYDVAAKLGIPSPPPYLSLSPNDDAILKGVNYASGGAGILNDTGLYFVLNRIFIIIITFQN